MNAIDQKILEPVGGRSVFYYQPIKVKAIEELGFKATQEFHRSIVCGKLGYTERPNDQRHRENALANPWLLPSIVSFPCNAEREGWIKAKFVAEHIQNFFGYGEMYLLTRRLYRWLLWAQKNLK